MIRWMPLFCIRSWRVLISWTHFLIKLLRLINLGILLLFVKCFQIWGHLLFTDAFHFLHLFLDGSQVVMPSRNVILTFLQTRKFLLQPESTQNFIILEY